MKGKKAGVVAGYSAMLIQNALSFFLTPFILGVLGASEFGVYRLVLAIASYFALADLGLSNAVVRYVAEYRAKKDRDAESRFVALILVVDVFASVLVLLAGVAVYRFLPVLFAGSFSEPELDLLLRMFPLLVLSGALGLFLNLANGVMKAHNEFGLVKVIDVVRSLVRAGAIVALLLSGRGAYSIVLMDTILQAAVVFGSAAYCAIVLKVTPRIRGLRYDYARGIVAYSLVVFVDTIAFHVLNGADPVIIGIMMSSAAVAVYSIGVVISATFHALSIVISDVLMPDVVAKIADSQSDEQMTDYMIQVGRIKLLTLALPTVGFAFLGLDFVTLWVGGGYSDAYYVALIVILPSMFAGLSDVGLNVMWARQKHKTKSLVSLAMAAINIVMTILLVDRIGVIGAAIGTAFAWILGYNLFNAMYYQRVLGLDMGRFYRQTFRGTWIAILGAAACAALVGAADNVSWVMLAAQLAVVSIVYTGLAWNVALDDSEKALVKSAFRAAEE